jgi:hypothetical protein
MNRREAVERELRFPAQAAGEDRERMALREALEQAVGGEPALAQDQAVGTVAVEDCWK